MQQANTKKAKATSSSSAEKNLKSTALVANSRDNLILTLFGRINIKKIKSKAALGTLALYGEMNNIQLSVTLTDKLTGIIKIREIEFIVYWYRFQSFQNQKWVFLIGSGLFRFHLSLFDICWVNIGDNHTFLKKVWFKKCFT